MLLACSSPALAGSAGKSYFAKLADATLDAYTQAPTATQQAWMRDHYSRMRTFSPYFDSRLSWYPNAWSYQNAYGIYPNQTSLDQYILKDSAGNRLYIQYNCSGGTCPLYAADIGDPGWRRVFIDQAKAKAAMGYRGVFVDDVNFAFKVSDGNENFVAPVDKRTGQPMTTDNWQRYMAEFMEQLRAELLASFEIVQNQVYFFAGGTSNPYVRRAIEASTIINVERGVVDAGLVGGTGTFGYETVLAWVEYIHSRGKGAVWDSRGTWGREYAMASQFLVANGLDFFHHPLESNPDNWWTGYETDLGAPLGQRYSWNGVFRRDFKRGIVLVNQPGGTTKTLSLGGNFTTLGGASTTSVSLPAREGLVLLATGSGGEEKALGRPASASSSYAAAYEPQKANDGASSTRWSSTFSDNQWWQVDLGSARQVNSVELDWEAAYAKTYKIQTSTDGTTFTDAATVTLDAAKVERTTFPTVTARYVRVLGLTRGTPYGFSFWDARVFGPDDAT